ncbi:MAG: FecR family protein [Sphingobacteriaceae bacterium]
MYNASEIAALIKKKIDSDLTFDERLKLNAWANENPIHQDFLNKVLQGDMIWKDTLKWMVLEESDQETWEKELERKVLFKIKASASAKTHEPQRIWRRFIQYAAIVCLVSTIGLLYFANQNYFSEKPVTIYNLDPGGNRAQLTLNGKVVELSTNMDGIIVGDKITYNDGTVIPLDQGGEAAEATLTTPKGGTYQITLPDGTKVWLNAASTLTYPTRFSQDERIVKLEGEAYFDVAKVYKKTGDGGSGHLRLPFLVKTSNQLIEVLGTQFNVMAYADEADTKTTLIEGSVLLKSNQENLKLIPGEQGILHQLALTKAVVDVNKQIAWKNNKFIFYETELRDAMKELSRWYNLEVIYEGKVPKTHFYGEISRMNDLDEVLKILKVGGVKFRIEKIGDKNRLIVSS